MQKAGLSALPTWVKCSGRLCMCAGHPSVRHLRLRLEHLLPFLLLHHDGPPPRATRSDCVQVTLCSNGPTQVHHGHLLPHPTLDTLSSARTLAELQTMPRQPKTFDLNVQLALRTSRPPELPFPSKTGQTIRPLRNRKACTTTSIA